MKSSFPKFTPIQVGPSLESYLCPVCRNRSNLRWTDESRNITVLGCNAVCASRMLKLNSNRIAADAQRGLGLIAVAYRPDYHDPKPPQSCADLPQRLTFDGEPSYTDERE
jgi:hypothetical protein